MCIHGDNLAETVSIADAVDRLQFMQRRFTIGYYHTDKRGQVHVIDEAAVAGCEQSRP